MVGVEGLRWPTHGMSRKICVVAEAGTERCQEKVCAKLAKGAIDKSAVFWGLVYL